MADTKVSPNFSFTGFDPAILWSSIKNPVKMIGSGLIGITTWYVAPLNPALSAAIGLAATGLGLAVFNTADFFFSQVKLK